MENKLINIRIPRDNFVRYYLILFNGGLKLTDNELTIIEEFINIYLKLKNEVTEEHLNFILFNPANRKLVREKSNIKSENSFNNYFLALKKKGIILGNQIDGYSLSEKILPSESVTFNFELI